MVVVKLWAGLFKARLSQRRNSENFDFIFVAFLQQQQQQQPLFTPFSTMSVTF